MNIELKNKDNRATPLKTPLLRPSPSGAAVAGFIEP